jgi:hypothetical protein
VMPSGEQDKLFAFGGKPMPVAKTRDRKKPCMLFKQVVGTNHASYQVSGGNKPGILFKQVVLCQISSDDTPQTHTSVGCLMTANSRGLQPFVQRSSHQFPYAAAEHPLAP